MFPSALGGTTQTVARGLRGGGGAAPVRLRNQVGPWFGTVHTSMATWHATRSAPAQSNEKTPSHLSLPAADVDSHILDRHASGQNMEVVARNELVRWIDFGHEGEGDALQELDGAASHPAHFDQPVQHGR